MPEDCFERLAADKSLRGNPLVPHLSSFAASLQEDGYATFTMQSKLGNPSRLCPSTPPLPRLAFTISQATSKFFR